MPTSLYNFQYVPLTGRLPGKSFVSQTEQAINGLAQYVYENSTNYEAVKTIAQKAEEDSSSALEYSEEALDKAQTALETVGRAYIKTTSAVDLNDYYDSELLLILSTESTNLPANISGYLTVMSSDTHDYCMQVYIGIDGSVYKRTATISDNTPTFGAWSETPITMSSLQAILADYAKANASNVGVNAQTDNSVAWGNAIGGGEIAEDEQRLITGGTVYPLSQNVAQNTSNIATNTADIVQNTGGISANSKRISNIEKLLQGNLYDYDTDDDTAYTKAVPTGALPYAGIEQIGGKTVVWNQLVDSGTTTVNTISGHKYYALIDGTVSIVTSDGTAISVVDDTADMVCDLTLMFGSGNEPSTTAEFTAIFGATHYAYNAGTLLSAGVTEVASKGANLIPTYTTSGSENGLTWTVSEDGSITINGTATDGTPIYAPISSWQWDGRTPCWLSGCPNGGSTNSYFLDIYGEDEWGAYQISEGDTGNGVILQPRSNSENISNIPLRFRIVIISGTQCNNLTFKPILNYGTSAATYSPYIGTISTYSIPASIQALEGYGWSAGDVYNYIDFERKVFVQNVGSVDMGTLNWKQHSTYTYIFLAAPTNCATGISSEQMCLCEDYTAIKCDTFVNFKNTDKTTMIGKGATSVYVADANYSSASASDFKSAMSGVILYYVLATPQEIDISEYLTDDNLIEVEAGGTLTFPNSNGTDYQIPVPSEETYMIDLQEAINNG